MLKVERHTKIFIRPLIKIDSFLDVSIRFINDTFTGAYTVPGNLIISYDGSGDITLVTYYNNNLQNLKPMKYAIDNLKGRIRVKVD